MENRFNIDFFEFSFLVEACIPPTPIARTMFFQKVIDVHYHEMTPEGRAKLYSWINSNSRFENSLKTEQLCIIFNARFDKDNQYKVTTIYDNQQTEIECFFLTDKYWINSTTMINDEYITEIKKLEV